MNLKKYLVLKYFALGAIGLALGSALEPNKINAAGQIDFGNQVSEINNITPSQKVRVEKLMRSFIDRTWGETKISTKLDPEISTFVQNEWGFTKQQAISLTQEIKISIVEANFPDKPLEIRKGLIKEQIESLSDGEQDEFGTLLEIYYNSNEDKNDIKSRETVEKDIAWARVGKSAAALNFALDDLCNEFKITRQKVTPPLADPTILLLSQFFSGRTDEAVKEQKDKLNSMFWEGIEELLDELGGNYPCDRSFRKNIPGFEYIESFLVALQNSNSRSAMSENFETYAREKHPAEKAIHGGAIAKPLNIAHCAELFNRFYDIFTAKQQIYSSYTREQFMS